MSERLQGKCKWFDSLKGFGFINPDGEPELDCFVHYRSIEMDGYRELQEGQRVTFQKIRSGDRFQAVEVALDED